MARPIVWPHKLGSAGAKALALSLDTKRVRTAGKYRPRAGDLVVNWGNSRVPAWSYAHDIIMLNHPRSVNAACNKLTALTVMKASGVNVPLFAVTVADMVEWLGGFKPMVLRHILRGTSGAGAEYVETEAQLNEADIAPLYVEYVKKTAEYRVHVFRGEVIDYAKKVRRRGIQNDSKIRNLHNGWVYARKDIDRIADVEAQAVAAVTALGLDFGAADVVWNQKRGAYVLEVNTAPGLQGTTVQSYSNAIKGML